MKPPSWTEQEINFLKKNYANNPVRFCTEKLGKSAECVKSRARKLGLSRKGFRMTEEQSVYITSHMEMTPTEIAKHLKISVKKVNGYIWRNQLSPANFTRYSEHQIEYLKQNFNTLSCKEIGAHIGRSADSVKNKAQCLGLKRTKAESWAIQERICSVTRFKKGQLPACTLHDGAISDRKDTNGITYRYIRISKSRWDLLHIVNWEKQNGPIKPGIILRCKNGNQLDCSPDNWEPLSRAEHLAKNSGRDVLTDSYVVSKLTHRNPALKEQIVQMPELIELKRNEIKLKRTINELT